MTCAQNDSCTSQALFRIVCYRVVYLLLIDIWNLRLRYETSVSVNRIVQARMRFMFHGSCATFDLCAQ